MKKDKDRVNGYMRMGKKGREVWKMTEMHKALGPGWMVGTGARRGWYRHPNSITIHLRIRYVFLD